MEQFQQPKQNSMAKASMILGFLAIFLAFTAFTIPFYAFFCGCMSILFAVLSRGSGLKMPDKALTGLITSIFALVITAFLSLIVLYLRQILAQKFGSDILEDPVALQKALNELSGSLFGPLETGGSGL